MKKLTKLKKLYAEYIRLKKETENEPTVLISPKGLQYINPVFLQMMQMRKELRKIYANK